MTRKQPKRKQRPGVDEYGRTELHHAAADGDAARVRALIDAGADANAADDDGWTPLHSGVQSGSAGICAALLATGAAVDPRDSHGNSPLWRAAMESRGSGDVILLLREHGADPRLANRYGISPVDVARSIANFDVAQFFADLPT